MQNDARDLRLRNVKFEQAIYFCAKNIGEMIDLIWDKVSTMIMNMIVMKFVLTRILMRCVHCECALLMIPFQ